MNIHYEPKMYTCSCCGKSKPETEFYRQAYTGKLSGQCKTCTNVKRSVQRHKQRTSKFISKEKQRQMEEIFYSLEDWKAAMLFFEGRCAYCGKPEGRAKADKLDRDHLVPCTKGGKTERKNIIPACPKCNRGRGNADFEPWFRKQPFFSEERLARIKKWVTDNSQECL